LLSGSSVFWASCRHMAACTRQTSSCPSRDMPIPRPVK
jgi:hypothetical protein